MREIAKPKKVTSMATFDCGGVTHGVIPARDPKYAMFGFAETWCSDPANPNCMILDVKREVTCPKCLREKSAADAR
jgi:hypothetical protein